MGFLVFCQSREQKLFDSHTVFLGISLDCITFAFGNIEADIIIVLLDILRRGLSLACLLLFFRAVLAILLRAGRYGIGLSADRTNLFAAERNGSAGLLLLSVGTVAVDLSLVTAVDTVFRTVGLAFKLHSAHLAFMLEQAYSPL